MASGHRVPRTSPSGQELFQFTCELSFLFLLKLSSMSVFTPFVNDRGVTTTQDSRFDRDSSDPMHKSYCVPSDVTRPDFATNFDHPDHPALSRKDGAEAPFVRSSTSRFYNWWDSNKEAVSLRI